MPARHFFQQSWEVPGEPVQLFIGALHPHGLHPLLLRYERSFRDLLSYCGEHWKILADALDVFKAQGYDMSTLQRLDIFYSFALKKKALRRPAYLSLLYKPGRYFFIILAIETPQQARLHEIEMMTDLAGL